MGFQAILASFLQSRFFLIEVFQEFKAGGQIDRLYTLVCRHLSRPLLRRALDNLPLPQGGGDRGLIARRGGQCKGYYCGHFGKPLGEPSDTPRMVAGYVPEARARSIQISSIPEASPPQGFVSLYIIYLVPRSRLIAPCLQVPLHKVPYSIPLTKLLTQVFSIRYRRRPYNQYIKFSK